MSRQYEWQQKRRAKGLCVTCGEKAPKHTKGAYKGKFSPYCVTHQVAARERSRRYAGHERRNDSWSYSLEKKK